MPNPMLRPLAGRNPAPPACGESWVGPLARLKVVFRFFSPVFSDLCKFFLLGFFSGFGSAVFFLIFHFIYFIFVLFFLKFMNFFI
jgi:hypothetical protein